jgi:hypothetical protein
MEEAAAAVLIGAAAAILGTREETTDTIFGTRDEAVDAGRERRGARDGAGDGRVRGLAEPCAIVLWRSTLYS